MSTSISLGEYSASPAAIQSPVKSHTKGEDERRGTSGELGGGAPSICKGRGEYITAVLISVGTSLAVLSLWASWEML